MRDEHGVTMVEVLATMAITGIIGVVLSAAIVTGLRTTEQTRSKLTETQERQLTSTHFVADVQSASEVATTSTCGDGAVVVSLAWNEAGVAKEAAYRLRTVAGAQRLSRALCSEGGAATVVDLARDLGAGSPVSVACAPSPCGAATERVVLSVTAASGRSFTATGVRRVA